MTAQAGGGRPEAAAAIWAWRDREAALAQAATRARRSGLLRGLVGGVISAGLWLLGAREAATIGWGLSSLVALLALLSPLRASRRLDELARAAGRLVGRALGWLLLAPVFLTFFVPFGLIRRRGARDPLRRSLDAEAPTYWKKLDAQAAAHRLERPF